MSGSEEETYSVMFSSLRHPARRKILRMLSERTMTFSEMLEDLAIPSSHLTYHLENLGELVIKDDDGKYKLSSFGKASVSMMKGAEEVPNAETKRFTALPLRWKTLFAAFTVTIVLLASFAYVQYASVNSLSSELDLVKANLDQIRAQNQQLLSWSPSTEKAMVMIRDVFQIDVSKYEASLIGNPTAEVRPDMGNIIEEVVKYQFANSQSRFEMTLRFRNNHFSLFQLVQFEGYPNYPLLFTQQQPTDVLQAARELMQRYRAATNDSYLDEICQLMASASGNDGDQTLGNTKLRMTSYGENSEVLLMYTENGADFETKGIQIVSQNHVVTELSDDWFLFKVGNSRVSISRDQAVLIAKEAARSFSWNANGTQITNFEVLDTPVSVGFHPHTKTEDLTLYPYWYVTLSLDKTYPGGVSIISVGIWADTGEVANIQALGGTASP
ncbi:MAG: winged helix-turn-helix domain-containing protein [Candidatus Bathyarchaeia archaeon]